MTADRDTRNWVGPVLQKGVVADAVIAAIRDLNDDVVVIDRGAYLRVLAKGRCRITCAAIAAHTRAPFHLPGDLELVMSSFKGTLEMTESEAIWRLRGEANP